MRELLLLSGLIAAIMWGLPIAVKSVDWAIPEAHGKKVVDTERTVDELNEEIHLMDKKIAMFKEANRDRVEKEIEERHLTAR